MKYRISETGRLHTKFQISKDHIAIFFSSLALNRKIKNTQKPQLDGKKLKYFFTFLVETANPKPKDAKT